MFFAEQMFLRLFVTLKGATEAIISLCLDALAPGESGKLVLQLYMFLIFSFKA